MELFYAEPDSIRDDLAILDDFERRHIVQTLRKKEGETIHFTDGRGHHYIGTILQLKPQLTVQIEQKTFLPQPKNPLTLACGFIKQTRLDFILEKGTELGVNHFIFFKSRYANYFSANQQRLNKIIRQALKQSLHFYFPTLTFFRTFEAFLKATQPFGIRLAAIDRTFPLLKEVLQATPISENMIMVIGPEGGFSSEEIQKLLQHGFTGFSLGNQRLRTETAALSAVSFVKQVIQ